MKYLPHAHAGDSLKRKNSKNLRDVQTLVQIYWTRPVMKQLEVEVPPDTYQFE